MELGNIRENLKLLKQKEFQLKVRLSNLNKKKVKNFLSRGKDSHLRPNLNIRTMNPKEKLEW